MFPGILQPRNVQLRPELGMMAMANHPLCPDLGLWMFAEGAGTLTRDLVGNDPMTINAPWQTNMSGPAARSDSTGIVGGRILSPTARLKPTTAFTLVWMGRIFSSGVTTNNPFFAGMAYDSGGGAPYLAYAIFRPTTATSCTISWNNGTFQSLATTSMLTNGESCMLVFTYGNGSAKFYKNGILKNSTTSGIGTITYGSDPSIYVGCNGITGNYTGIDTGMVALYGRVLTADQVMQLYVEPYSFVQTETRWPAKKRSGVPWAYFRALQNAQGAA